MAKEIEIDYEYCGLLASQGMSEKQIALLVGVSLSTLEKRKAKYKEFKEILREGKAKGLETVTAALLGQVRAGNINAIKYYLSNRDPSRWHERKAPEEKGAADSIAEALSKLALNLPT